MTEVAALGLRVDGVDNIDSASSSLDRFTKSSKSADQASGGLSTESRNASKALADVAREGGRSSASISKLAGAAKAAGGVLAAAFSVAAISGGIKTSLRTFADFEAQMARVSAVSRASADDFERLTATARKLGAETEFSASQAGAGLEFLARAGWSASDSIAAIPAILDLATAASLDLGNAADVASNIMSAYGIAAKDAANVSDILAAATARANTDVRQLGDAMSYVGPVAASLGISMGDSAAAIGALSDAGIQGSSAGTGLRRVLSSLANPAKAARDQLAALGVSLEDVNPQTNDLADIIDTLAASGMDAAQALTVFGDRGGPAILALVEQRFKVRELSKELRDVGGEASQMADVIRDTLEGDLQGLSSAFADVQISIGKAFSGNARSLVQSLTSALRAFGENIETIANTVVLATKLVAAYVVAVYTIPAAKALASAATTAYTGVLRIFSTQAAMTTKQLLSMRTALSLAAAAFAGWQIGTYLRKEFEIVEKAGIALMSGLHQAAIQIGGYFERMGESIRFALTNPLDAFRNKLADLLQSLTGLGQGTLRALGLDGLADTIGKGIETIRSKTGEEHRALLEQMRRDTDAEAAAVSDIYFELFASVGKNAKEASSGISDLADGVSELAEETVKLTAAQKAAAAAEKRRLEGILDELSALERAVATWGMTSEEVKIYDLAMQGATATQLEYAQGLLDTLAGLEKAKEEGEAYLQLVKDLRTEEERLTDEFHERIGVLDAMAASTRIASDEYAAMASRVAEAAFTAAPEFGGLAPEVGGPFGELLKIDEAQEKLQLWYDTQLEMLNEFRAERSDLNAQWDAQEEALKQEHEAKLAGIERARHMASLSLAGDFFGQMSALQKSESSKARAIGKVAAIAEANINTYRAATAAYAAMAGIPVVGPSLGVAAASAAIAAGLANVAAIQGQAHDGIMSVPEDGTWLLEKGERVTTAETSAKLDRTLDEVMGRMQALPANVIPFPSQPSSSAGNSTNVVVNVHNAPPGTEVEQSTGADGVDVIDVWIADFTSGGRTASAVQGKFGLQPQGR